MTSRIVTFFTRSTTGRVIAVAALLVGAAYATRFYYVDLPKIDEREEAAAGEQKLEALADALETAMAADDAKPSLPHRTQWHPRALPCDATIKFGASPEPVWEILGVRAEDETPFQYRFEQRDGTWRIRARRDRDCDGIFAVWTVEGSTDWTALMGRSQSAQNIGE